MKISKAVTLLLAGALGTIGNVQALVYPVYPLVWPEKMKVGLVVHGATGVCNADSGNKGSDSYVKVYAKYDTDEWREVGKTDVVHNNANPTWNEQFSLNDEEELSKSLWDKRGLTFKFEIMDKDSFSDDDKLGSAVTRNWNYGEAGDGKVVADNANGCRGRYKTEITYSVRIGNTIGHWVCMRPDQENGDFTVKTLSAGSYYKIQNELDGLNKTHQLAYKNDIVVVNGYPVKLGTNCRHETATLCTREPTSDGDLDAQKVVKGSESASKLAFEQSGLDTFEPGETIAFHGVEGTVQSGCQIKFISKLAEETKCAGDGVGTIKLSPDLSVKECALAALEQRENCGEYFMIWNIPSYVIGTGGNQECYCLSKSVSYETVGIRDNGCDTYKMAALPSPSSDEGSPTSSPSGSPTNPPTGSRVVQDKAPGSSLGASSGGDPHFKTFNGTKFDFHGGCDLVLLSNPHFDNGRGLEIHGRTKIESTWSFIESAAIKLGDNTLEIKGGKKQISYWLDGVEVDQMETGNAALGDHAIHFNRISQYQSQTRVDLGHGNAMSIETYKRFARVNTKVVATEKFVGTYGMFGNYPEGKLVGRDKATIFEDTNAFGFEWQVRATDPQLFHSAGPVQFPMKCAMPDMTKRSQTRRRLGEATISEEDATLACSRVSANDLDACVFDVMATNDKGMAGSY